MDAKPETDESESESIFKIYQELAVKAADLFDKCHYSGSLVELMKLQEHRPLDTRITQNEAVVRFYGNGFKNVDGFQKKLNSICSQVS